MISIGFTTVCMARLLSRGAFKDRDVFTGETMILQHWAWVKSCSVGISDPWRYSQLSHFRIFQCEPLVGDTSIYPICGKVSLLSIILVIGRTPGMVLHGA